MKKTLSPFIVFKFISFLLISFIFFTCSSDENENHEKELSLTEAQAMLSLVNEVRLESGLNSLTLNNILNEVAYAHSLDMDTNDYFSHTGLNGSSFSERAFDADYEGSTTGENIANGQQNTKDVFTSWMNSAGHKNNILNAQATEMGFGVSNFYWTQIFGKENAN